MEPSPSSFSKSLKKKTPLKLFAHFKLDVKQNQRLDIVYKIGHLESYTFKKVQIVFTRGSSCHLDQSMTMQAKKIRSTSTTTIDCTCSGDVRGYNLRGYPI